MQERRIWGCGLHPTDSRNNLLDGKTDEATSQCPQPRIQQELVGEEEEAAARGWRWGPSSALPVHLPPTLMPPAGKKQHSCPCCPLTLRTKAPRPPRASHEWHQEASGSHACLQPGPFVPHRLSPGEVDVSFSFNRTQSSLIQI